MPQNKTISVWLRTKDGKVALQERSSFGGQSHPDVCQATWAGKVEEAENLESAIKRECAQELGKEFAENFDFSSLKFFSENKFKMKDDDWTCYNYIGEVNENLLSKAKLHNEAKPNFVFADKDNFEEIDLFEDQKKVLKEIINETRTDRK